jgi:His-Xaa-Ser system protein HxsD
MNFDIDLSEKTVSFEAARPFYSRKAVEIAAHVFESRAEVYLDEAPKAFSLTLKSRRVKIAEADLEALAGSFLNELLNQEYRFLVGGFNKKISDLISTQALFCARGGEKGVEPVAEERTPEFKAAVAKLVKEAQDEAKRTMPKKIPDQGAPLPPAAKE